MRSDRNRRSTLTLAAALGLVSAAGVLNTPARVLAQAAGTPSGAQAVTAADLVAQARALADAGKLIQARAIIDRLMSSADAQAMNRADLTRAMALQKSVVSQLQTADPQEMSVQKAEWALESGDLLAAERHAGSVAGTSLGTKAQRDRAQSVIDGVKARRAELAPLAPGLIEQAKADFAAKRFADAKTSILSVLRSGVTLSADQATTLEHMQLDIVNLEQAQGHAFEGRADASMMQPGNVRHNEPGRPEPLPPVAGEQPPANTAPVAPPPPAAPEPAAQPSAPAPAPAPTMSAPTQDDVVTLAMRGEAGRIVAEGDQAFEQARYTAAVDKYTLALGAYRQYLAAGEAERVQKRIDEARVRLGAANGGGGDLVRSVTGTDRAIRERADAEFSTYVAQAEAALAKGQPDQAQSLLAQAKLSMSQARGQFNDSEIDTYQKRLDTLLANIEKSRDEIRNAEAAKRSKDAQDKAAAAESNRLAERSRKVSENIDRIRELQKEKKYREALQVVDQTLFIDPLNPTALLLKDILADVVAYETYNKLQDDKTRRLNENTLENEAETVPPVNLMEFPTEWPQKSFVRGEQSAFADSADNRKVLAQMSSPASKLPGLDMTENRFEDVLKFLNTVTQLPIDPDWESLAAIGVEKDTPVTLKVQNPLTIQAALDRILTKVSRDQFQRAGWSVNDGIITVASDETLRKHRVLVIYNIQDLLFQIPNYRDVPQIDLNTVLQSNQGGGGGSPFTGDQQQNNPDDPAARERRVRQIIDIIYNNVDFEGWKDNGGETGALQELNGSLIITNTPRNHREIVGLLSKLREIRNMQINVETKFLLVNQQWFEQIGFDLDIVFNAGSNQVTTARQNDPSIRPSDFFDFTQRTSIGRQIQGAGPINGRLGPITGTDRTNQATVPPDTLSPIGTLQNSLGLTQSLSEGDFAANILSQAPALGIAGQFLDDIQVDFLIVATQADKRSVRLTAPRLTFTNGQTANIYVATQVGFISQLQPIVGDSAVGFNPTPNVVSEGVTMLIEGVVSSDRRYVTMNIDSGISRIDDIRRSPVTAIAGGQLVNSADTQSFIELPQVTVTRVRTTATVPDEGTLLIGGQRLITEVEVETGVPVLSKIPIINRFFTNRLEVKEEQSLLILIKPTILIQTEEEEKAFPGLTDSVRSGVGFR